MNKIKFLLLISLISIFVSCSKTDTAPNPTTPNPCAGIIISPVATITNTITGQSVGTITVSSPIGAGFLYSIDGTNFQASTNFFNLAVGNYTLTVKNASGCTGTITLQIIGYGPKFFNVRNIVNGFCGPCHLNGSVNGGMNFDTDNAVVNAWDRIKIRTVDGTPSFMPPLPNANLTAVDKQKIVDWVNAGHRITD